MFQFATQTLLAAAALLLGVAYWVLAGRSAELPPWIQRIHELPLSALAAASAGGGHAACLDTGFRNSSAYLNACPSASCKVPEEEDVAITPDFEHWDGNGTWFRTVAGHFRSVEKC